LSNKSNVIEFVSKADKTRDNIRKLLKRVDVFVRKAVKSSACSKDFSDVVADYFKLSGYLQSANLDDLEFSERAFQVLYRAVIITDEIRKSVLDRQGKLNKLFDESSHIYRDLEKEAISIKRKINKKKTNKTAKVTELLDVMSDKKVME